MKKVLMILISMLLLISFFLMIIPASIRLLYPISPHGPTLFTKTPTFEENPALFYASFVSSVLGPLLEKEEELLFLYSDVENEIEAKIALRQMELDINELSKSPKYQHEGLEPVYAAHEQMKEAFVKLILASEDKKSFSTSSTLFNIEVLQPLYEAYLEKKDDLYQVTIKTLKDLKIVFYLEDNGTITVYNP